MKAHHEMCWASWKCIQGAGFREWGMIFCIVVTEWIFRESEEWDFYTVVLDALTRSISFPLNFTSPSRGSLRIIRWLVVNENLVETMAPGLPSIVTRSGGCPSLFLLPSSSTLESDSDASGHQAWRWSSTSPSAARSEASVREETWEVEVVGEIRGELVIGNGSKIVGVHWSGGGLVGVRGWNARITTTTASTGCGLHGRALVRAAAVGN